MWSLLLTFHWQSKSHIHAWHQWVWKSALPIGRLCESLSTGREVEPWVGNTEDNGTMSHNSSPPVGLSTSSLTPLAHWFFNKGCDGHILMWSLFWDWVWPGFYHIEHFLISIFFLKCRIFFIDYLWITHFEDLLTLQNFKRYRKFKIHN